METKERKEIVQEELNSGKSIAWWAMGLYKMGGDGLLPNMLIPFFGLKDLDKDKPIVYILIEYYGKMMWVNVRREKVYLDTDYKEKAVRKQLIFEVRKNRN